VTFQSITGHLVEGDAKRTKVLAVVSHQTETALFVYDTTGIPGGTQISLLLDRILPIRRQFQCSLRKGMGRQLSELYPTRQTSRQTGR
jgi:hypothetical protein